MTVRYYLTAIIFSCCRGLEISYNLVHVYCTILYAPAVRRKSDDNVKYHALFLN